MRDSFLNSARQVPWITALLFVPVVVIAAIPGLQEGAEFDRHAVKAGQWYRLLTCHWTHWSLDHLLWDSVPLLVIGFICERASRSKLLWCVGCSAIAIGAAVMWMRPEMTHFRGLSGIDCALYCLLAALIMRRGFAERSAGRILPAALMLAAFLGKTAFEQWTGRTLFVENHAGSVPPVPMAHLVGAAVGLIVGVVGGASPRIKRSDYFSAALS